MGIKFFFKWLKQTFPRHIKQVSIFQQTPFYEPIDHFLVDMNGIIHYCCQKWYGYGAFKDKDDIKKGKDVISEIIHYVDRIVKFVKPQKTVFLAVDGVAPLSKQFQQRSRRYKTSANVDIKENKFNSNSITPGTIFLNDITFAIHKWISKKIEKDWSNLTILFSSEKAPGEGEHKLMKWVREFGDPRDSYMIHGMDADLIMLALATHFPRFHILRDNTFKPEVEFFHIAIEPIRDNLITNMMQDLSEYSDQSHINDFIVMIFLTGNDFLPTIPTIDLIDDGAEYLFRAYRKTVKDHGTITNDNGFIKPDVLSHFFGNLSLEQVFFLEEKRSKSGYFPDSLLESHTKIKGQNEYEDKKDDDDKDNEKKQYKLDWESYRIGYYKKKFGIENIENDQKQIDLICHQYLEGITWVLDYYLRETPHWKWAYKHLYAPFFSDLSRYSLTMNMGRPSYHRLRDNTPFSPFLQLLCVLPQSSSDLLPSNFCEIMDKIGENGYPKNIEIDLSGKRYEWEGIVQLPELPLKEIEKLYKLYTKNLTKEESQRNRLGCTFEYSKDQGCKKHALSM